MAWSSRTSRSTPTSSEVDKVHILFDPETSLSGQDDFTIVPVNQE